MRRLYRTTAVVLLNFTILFVLVNLAAALWLALTSRDEGQRSEIIDLFIRRHGMETLRAAYPGMSDPEIRGLLNATGVIGNRYHPFVEFVNAAHVSPQVVMRPEGFRVGPDQAPWPPPSSGKTVFVFGGSTTYAAGVLSHQTIPAYLQQLLRANFAEPVNVYNFGTGAHYSTQELLLFLDWLRQGIRPDLAIFIDGINDLAYVRDVSALSAFFDQAYERHKLTLGQSGASVWTRLGELVLSLPISRLHQPSGTEASLLFRGATKLRDDNELAAWRRSATPEETTLANRLLDRYQVNLRAAAAIGASAGVETVFVWQPAPLYKYDFALHPFAIQPQHQLHRVAYPLMAERRKAGALPANFAWCADVQEGAREMLYVDQLHYRPPVMQRIADCMVRHMLAAGTFDRLGWTRKSGEFFTPETAEAGATPKIMTLTEVIDRHPDRLYATNVTVARAGGEVRLAPSGRPEHYLQVITELPDSGEYRITMRVRPARTGAFRLQAWDSGTEPSGVVADVSFATSAMRITNVKGARSFGQVARRDDTYDVNLAVSLPGGITRLLIQLTDGPLQIDGLEIARSEG
jgi:hypothetical protein